MRVTLVTPCFAPTRLVAAMFARLYATVERGAVEHWLLHNHYPGNDPKELRSLCERYGVQFFDTGADIGCCPSLNEWAANVGRDWPADQLIVTLDPDACPDRPGWLDAMRAVMSSPDVAACALMVRSLGQRFHAWQVEERNNFRVLFPPVVQMMHATGWNWGAIKAAGGWREPMQTGGLEAAMWPRFAAEGRRVGYLVDYADRWGRASEGGAYPDGLFDESYIRWRTAHRAGNKLKYGEWLAQQADAAALVYCRCCTRPDLEPLADGWRRCRFCGSDSNSHYDPAAVPPDEPEDLQPVADWFEDHRRGTPPPPNLDFLDVGHGSGRMLAEMQNRGWKVHGFDTDPARHLGAHTTIRPLFHAGFTTRRYGAVHCAWRLERTPGWRQILAEIAGVTMGHGLVQIRTGRPAALGSPNYHAGHAQLLSPVLLRQELAPVGLSVIDWRVTPTAQVWMLRKN